MQVLNDGADEEDFKQLLEILKGFGEVEVLYDPNDPKDKDVTVIYIGTGQFQLASGKWVDAILYKYNGVYKMMEASEFVKLAEPDKSTTLDAIGNIIGPGYTPDIESDR